MCDDDLSKYQIKSITPVDKYVCTLSEETKKFAFQEFGETEELRQNGIREIRDWALANKRIVKMRLDGVGILRYLRRHKFSIKSSKESIERTLILREGLYSPELDWFTNLDFERPNLKELLDSGLCVILPDYAPTGERIIFARFSACNPKFPNAANSALCLATQILEILFEDEENQVRGFQYVFDVSEITLRHYFILSFSTWFKILKNCERTFGGRHRGAHLLNLPSTVKFVLKLAFRNMEKKMADGIKLYGNVDELEFIDKDKLPEEFGGKASLKEITDVWFKKLTEYRPFLLNYQNMKINQEYYTPAVLNCEVKTLAGRLENPNANLLRDVE